MKLILVRGADGAEHELALVRQTAKTAYACPTSKYQEAMRGSNDAVVGFPITDIVETSDADARH